MGWPVNRLEQLQESGSLSANDARLLAGPEADDGAMSPVVIAPPSAAAVVPAGKEPGAIFGEIGHAPAR